MRLENNLDPRVKARDLSISRDSVELKSGHHLWTAKKSRRIAS